VSSSAERERRWELRETAPPRASFEELEIHTEDGVALRAVVDDPPEDAVLRGTVVLAHAMFARKSSFGKRGAPGLAVQIAKQGFRTIAFDFRGHGDSVLPRERREWSYDDLVRRDLPAVVGCARARSEDLPVIVVGHSLGGHVALASQGSGQLDADAIVGVAANVWLPELEPSRMRRLAKRVTSKVTLAAADRFGRVPARRLRIGSDDASKTYIHDLLGVVKSERWGSADGEDDYLASLANVKVPVANVLGTRDHLMCTPAAGEAFVARCRGPVRTFHADAGHMSLVRRPEAQKRILDALEWVVKSLTR
jgi:predicted alpha/beta hydrolase